MSEQIILPSGFRRLSYIQSSGTQYITTDYYPEAGQKYILMDIEFINISDLWEGNKNIFSASEKGNPAGAYDILYGCGMNFGGSDNQRYEHFFWVGGDRNDNNSVCSAKWEADTVLNRNIFEIKGDTCTYGSQTVNIINGGTRAGTTPLTIFGAPDKPIGCYGMRLYEFKMGTFENNQVSISLHLIPCLDDTNKVCMYDVVNGKVYYNKGAGDFLYELYLEDEELGILHKLPEGFTKVNYLIANGSQYIDTNYVPTNETGYYLEGQGYVSETTARYFFGSNETTDWNANQRIYFCATPNNVLGWMTSITVTNVAANLRQETNVALNFLNSRKCITTINDADIINELDDLTFTPSQKIFLFNLNLGGIPISNQGLKGRIDTFLISEGDQIVRQFVPCLDADGIPCMYELYTGTVHYNQGAGKFSYPRVYTNDPINLPSGYTKCVYLQSNGTQWIDTGVIPNADTGVYVKAQRLNYGDFIIFGSWENSSAYFYPPRFNTTNKAGVYSFGTTYQLVFYYDKGDDLIYTSTMNLYNDRTVNLWSEDTNWTGIISVAPSVTFTRPLWLFSYNMDNATINATYAKWGGRMFRAKITQGDTLIHDFVPCLDADNRPCMYDMVSQTPYYNQSGGEEFDYCVEHQLPSDFSKLKYLESNSNLQHIKTGYIPTNNTGMYVDAYNTVVDDVVVMGIQNTTSGNDRMWIGGVMKATYGARYGWGTVVTPGGTGDVRFEASLNWLNDKKSIITCPAFAQRVNALSDLTFTPNQDIYIFGWNRQGSLNHWKGRIYRAKISEGSEIVRDFVPAYDSRRDKPCMYDLINNVAYYNDGEGEFLTNRDFEGDYLECGVLSCIGNRLGGEYDPINEKLPSGYTRVEFLRGTGQQYIKTEIYPDGETGFEIEYFIKSLVYNMNLFGAREAWLNNQYQLLASPEYIQFRYAKSNQFFHCNETPEYNTSTFASFLNNKVVIGSKKGVVSRRVFECPSPLYVFGGSQMGEINENCFRGGIYYFNLYESGDLILKFIPTIDPSGVPCMYDIVTDRPFYNNGTGQFIVGMKTLSQAISLRLPEIGGTLQLSLPTNDNIEYYEEKIRANNPSWNFTFSYH